jgi:hypothetical protein
MPERAGDAAAPALTELLATVDRRFERRDGACVARIPTPKEIEASRSSNLAGRIGWLLLRRMTAGCRPMRSAVPSGRSWSGSW